MWYEFKDYVNRYGSWVVVIGYVVFLFFISVFKNITITNNELAVFVAFIYILNKLDNEDIKDEVYYISEVLTDVYDEKFPEEEDDE